jgi:hypothetical protein
MVFLAIIISALLSGCLGKAETQEREGEDAIDQGDDPSNDQDPTGHTRPAPVKLNLTLNETGQMVLFNMTWIRYDLFTSGGGETGCCFLEGNVLVVSRNGGFGIEATKSLQFIFLYPDGTSKMFRRNANTADGEEEYFGSYALASGSRFDGSDRRLILSNGFYCDGDPADPERTYGDPSRWKYDGSYKHGNVHGWSVFPLIGHDMELTNEFDEQDVLAPDNITFSVAYGNEPEGHTLSIGRYDGTVETVDLTGIGATWPSIAGGKDHNPIVITWMSDDGGVEMLVSHSY